eukprot:6214055-Pleurochrysis_carterae.AAC.2
MEATAVGRTATALEWFADFLTSTERMPFVDPAEPEGARYNNHTLVLFADFVRQCGSRQRSRAGATIRADTIGGYVPAVKLLRSREAGCDIAPEVLGGPLAQALKRMRQLDPPAGFRKLSRAFRAAHFRAAAAAGARGGTEQSRMDWAAALLAHNLLLRAGEIGHPLERSFDAARDLTWAFDEWRSPTAASRGHSWLLVHVVPTKDTRARHKAVPLPVRRRRRDGDEGDDPVCAYDALRRTWEERQYKVPLTERTFGRRSNTPLFTKDGGARAWNSDDSRALAKQYAEILDLDASDFGGKCWRIGGATDLRDVRGDAAAAQMKQRGRWESDVAAIY